MTTTAPTLFFSHADVQIPFTHEWNNYIHRLAVLPRYRWHLDRNSILRQWTIHKTRDHCRMAQRDPAGDQVYRRGRNDSAGKRFQLTFFIGARAAAAKYAIMTLSFSHVVFLPKHIHRTQTPPLRRRLWIASSVPPVVLFLIILRAHPIEIACPSGAQKLRSANHFLSFLTNIDHSVITSFVLHLSHKSWFCALKCRPP